MVLIESGDQRLIHAPAFLSREEADALMRQLIQTITWRQNRIRMFGKWLNEPRQTAWFGPAYTYSGIHWEAVAMPQLLAGLAQRLDGGIGLNAALLNRYRSGSDSMGWHRDNEPEVDQRLIASLSLGATRRFSVKPMGGGAATHVELAHGDALWMWNLQESWQHQVPKTKRNVSDRINLTFRRIKASE